MRKRGRLGCLLATEAVARTDVEGLYDLSPVRLVALVVTHPPFGDEVVGPDEVAPRVIR